MNTAQNPIMETVPGSDVEMVDYKKLSYIVIEKGNEKKGNWVLN